MLLSTHINRTHIILSKEISDFAWSAWICLFFFFFFFLGQCPTFILACFCSQVASMPKSLLSFQPFDTAVGHPINTCLHFTFILLTLRCCLDEGCFEWYDPKLITHHPKLVGPTKKILYWLHHFVLVILSLKNLSDEA